MHDVIDNASFLSVNLRFRLINENPRIEWLYMPGVGVVVKHSRREPLLVFAYISNIGWKL